MDQDNLDQVQNILGYNFKDISLLSFALTHSSFTEDRTTSNERLEFFGDAILGLIICKQLFERFPEYQEGDLTKIKSLLVSRKTCSQIMQQFDLNQYISIGKGMEKTRALNGSISAGAIEAIIAAIYIDGGFEPAQDFILRAFGPMIDQANANNHNDNFKSILQQYAQKHMNTMPRYDLLDEKGPDHNKCFECSVSIGSRYFSSAWSITKKDAEQRAAYNALVELGVLAPEEETD